MGTEILDIIIEVLKKFDEKPATKVSLNTPEISTSQERETLRLYNSARGYFKSYRRSRSHWLTYHKRAMKKKCEEHHFCPE